MLAVIFPQNVPLFANRRSDTWGNYFVFSEESSHILTRVKSVSVRQNDIEQIGRFVQQQWRHKLSANHSPVPIETESCLKWNADKQDR